MAAPGSSPVAAERLLHAARQLEAVFHLQLLRSMREAKPVEGGLFEPSPGEEFFRDMLDEVVARILADRSTRGPGEAMFQQLSRHLQTLTAGDVAGTAGQMEVPHRHDS